MATVTVRNIDPEDYERLKRDARANHRSVEAELRSRASRPKISQSDFIERLRRNMIETGPDYEGSVALIRAIRDEA